MSKQRGKKPVTALEKMYLLDESTFKKWKEENDENKQLSILDKNMKIIMNKKDLSVTRKWMLYKNFLAEYANLKRLMREQNDREKRNDANKFSSSAGSNNNNKVNNEKDIFKRSRGNQTEEVKKANVETNTPGNIIGDEEVFALNTSDDDDLHMKTAQELITTIKNNPAMLENYNLSELYDDDNALNETPQMSANERREQDELHRKYDDILIAESTVNAHLAKASKPVQDAYNKMNPTARTKKIRVDEEELEIDLNKTKIDSDGILIAEDTSGGQITTNINDLSDDDLYSIRSYLAEKHNQIEDYMNEEIKENQNKTSFESFTLDDGTLVVKFRDEIMKIESNDVLEYVENYLHSGYAPSNVTLKQIVSWARQHLSGEKYSSKLPHLKGSKTPKSSNISRGPSSSSTPVSVKRNKNKSITKSVSKRAREDTPSKSITSYYKQRKLSSTVGNETPKLSGKKDEFDIKRKLSEGEHTPNRLRKWETLYS